MGRKYDGPKRQGYWKNWDNVESELLAIIKELNNKFPTSGDLEKLGRSDLYAAIKSNWGGILKVKKVLADIKS